MRREILQYEYTCDRCGKIERVERVENKKHELPEGWASRRDLREVEICGGCV